MIYQYLKVFYSRIAEQYSTQLGINHYLVMGMGIQVCSNEGALPFPSGDTNEIAKVNLPNL